MNSEKIPPKKTIFFIQFAIERKTSGEMKTMPLNVSIISMAFIRAFRHKWFDIC